VLYVTYEIIASGLHAYTYRLNSVFLIFGSVQENSTHYQVKPP